MAAMEEEVAWGEEEEGTMGIRERREHVSKNVSSRTALVSMKESRRARGKRRQWCAEPNKSRPE